MLKKTFTILLSVTLSNVLYSQEKTINVYQVEYEKSLTFEDDPNNPIIGSYEYTKFIELNKSVFKKNRENKSSNSLIQDRNDDTVIYFSSPVKNHSVVFKDYEKGEFYSRHEVAYKYFSVKDYLDVFDWSILDETKKILGYNCQLATMNYRGRQYVAWFTTELPIGGPWKYDGLPGMILEIKSKDNFIAFKASRIKNGVIEIEDVKNPFQEKKSITWLEFKALYKKKALELITYSPDENYFGVESSRGGIEFYIDKDDKEYNKAIKKLPGN